MLNAIDEEAEAQRLTQALGIEFPVIQDRGDRWGRSALALRQTNPFLMVFKDSTRLGVVSPAMIRALRAHIPSGLSPGRDY